MHGGSGFVIIRMAIAEGPPVRAEPAVLPDRSEYTGEIIPIVKHK